MWNDRTILYYDFGDRTGDGILYPVLLIKAVGMFCSSGSTGGGTCQLVVRKEVKDATD